MIKQNINPVKTPTPVPIALPAAPCLAISYVILLDGRYGKISTYAIKILKIAFKICSMIWEMDVGTIVLCP